MKANTFQLTHTIELLPLLYDEKTAAELAAFIQRKAKEITGTKKGSLPMECEGKPELVRFCEDATTICDCLSACKWIGIGWWAIWPFAEESQKAALLSAGTGVETSVDTLFKLAGRVRMLEQAYNARQGMTRDMDTLPKKFLDKPVYGRIGMSYQSADEEFFKGQMLKSSELEKMKSKYYALRGWDVATGIPTREALVEAGLGDVAKDLEKRGKLPGPSPKGDGSKQ